MGLQIQDLNVDEVYDVQAQGMGTAILTIVTKYNLPEVPVPPKYDLNVTILVAEAGADAITVEVGRARGAALIPAVFTRTHARIYIYICLRDASFDYDFDTRTRCNCCPSQACARMIPKTNDPSGAMLLDIGIFSGYKPDVTSLKALAAEDNNVDMFELADKKVSAES